MQTTLEDEDFATSHVVRGMRVPLGDFEGGYSDQLPALIALSFGVERIKESPNLKQKSQGNQCSTPNAICFSAALEFVMELLWCWSLGFGIFSAHPDSDFSNIDSANSNGS